MRRTQNSETVGSSLVVASKTVGLDFLASLSFFLSQSFAITIAKQRNTQSHQSAPNSFVLIARNKQASKQTFYSYSKI